ncbi:MAG TPA: hypothetical protein VGQ27_09870 [Steroidobacteraceae bacterium]|nr:hypothetical protein [Steroidobacteraceae bacterium]
MSLLVAAFVVGTQGVALGGAGCSKHDLHKKDTATIELDAPKHGAREQPAFYLREPEHNLVLFFKPRDVLTVLEQRAGDSRLANVVAEIRADLPLKEDTDLFKYDLRGEGFDGLLDFIVADLLDAGHAVVDYVPIHAAGSDSSRLNDVYDPTTIKRVHWENRGGDGRTYCSADGFFILDVTDTIND